MFWEDRRSLSFANLQLRAIRLALWNANPSVLPPPNVSSVEVWLGQWGNYSAVFSMPKHGLLIGPPGISTMISFSFLMTLWPLVLWLLSSDYSNAGDASRSASSPNLVINLEDLRGELEVSTDQIGITGRTPSVVTLPPVTVSEPGRAIAKLVAYFVGHTLHCETVFLYSMKWQNERNGWRDCWVIISVGYR